MICPRCGIDTEEEKCPKCGSTMNKNKAVDHSKIDVQTDSLLDIYIGRNIEKIAGKPSNFAAGLFRTFYLLYRKQIFLALLNFSFVIFSWNLSTYDITPFYICQILSMIFWTAFFNPIYISLTKKRIKKFQKQNLTQEQIKNKGDIKPSYIFYFLFILFILFMIWYCYIHFDPSFYHFK